MEPLVPELGGKRKVRCICARGPRINSTLGIEYRDPSNRPTDRRLIGSAGDGPRRSNLGGMDDSGEEREFVAGNALASIRLEGAEIDGEMQELADRYAAGDLSADELAEFARTGAFPIRRG
jgi:hypothetical protein